VKLNQLRAPKGAMKKRFKVGRGPASGLGKTSGRGQKGAGARKSSGQRGGFEGGQNPFQRRVPKRGFNSRFAEVEIVNIGALDKRFTGMPRRRLKGNVMARESVTKTLSLAASLGVTFPFNLLVGIPLYHAMTTQAFALTGGFGS
jgi:ribosomal protein L15